MSPSLLELYREQSEVTVSEEAVSFLQRLEASLADDLWKSRGGHWSQESIDTFRRRAMHALARTQGQGQSLDEGWKSVVRDFHRSAWEEVPLPRREKKPPSEESRIFWELFPYIWVFLQAGIIMKMVVFYFGIRSVDEAAEPTNPIWLYLAIAFSFGSLFLFAYRRYK